MVILDKYFILASSVYYDYVWWLFYIHWLLLADIYDEEDDDPDTIPDEDTNLQDGTPDWVKSEKDQFINHRDKNMDGKLDEEEVKAWVIPEDYDHSASEALHLVNACDSNKVGLHFTFIH